MVNNKLSEVMELLRFPLALAVVYLHCGGTAGTTLYKDGLDTTFLDLLRITISHVITHVAVPSFFLISGYLYFKEGEINPGLYLKKEGRRLVTLVIPYLLWNIIPLFYILLKRVGGAYVSGNWENVCLYWKSIEWLHVFWDIEPLNQTSQNILGISTELSGPINFPLWYLRDLILLTIFSPLVYIAIKYGRKYMLFILIVCFLSGIWFTHRILPITGVLFFSLGAYFSINKIDFLHLKIMASPVLKILTVICCVIAIFYDGMNTYIGTIAYKLFIVTGVFMTFHIAHGLVEKGFRIKTWLTEFSFFIYVAHFLFIFLINIHRLIVDHFIRTTNEFLLTIDYLLYPLLITALCVTTGYLLKKYLPFTYSFLTGSR
jgi:putative succinyltransferase